MERSYLAFLLPVCEVPVIRNLMQYMLLEKSFISESKLEGQALGTTIRA